MPLALPEGVGVPPQSNRLLTDRGDIATTHASFIAHEESELTTVLVTEAKDTSGSIAMSLASQQAIEAFLLSTLCEGETGRGNIATTLASFIAHEGRELTIQIVFCVLCLWLGMLLG